MRLKSKVPSLLFILIGAVLLIAATAGNIGGVWFKIAGLIILMIGLYQATKTARNHPGPLGENKKADTDVSDRR